MTTTTTTIYDPFSEMRAFMRRAFDGAPSRVWLDDFDGFAVAGHNRALRHQSLPLDVYETDDGLVVEAQLPGYAKDDVAVTLEKGKLSIRAERQTESDDGDDQDARKYFLRERRLGALSRSLTIGESYDPESVAASLKDGVLTLTVAKAADARPKQIEIAVD